jgi:hypothetical protein
MVILLKNIPVCYTSSRMGTVPQKKKQTLGLAKDRAQKSINRKSEFIGSDPQGLFIHLTCNILRQFSNA